MRRLIKDHHQSHIHSVRPFVNLKKKTANKLGLADDKDWRGVQVPF